MAAGEHAVAVESNGRGTDWSRSDGGGCRRTVRRGNCNYSSHCKSMDTRPHDGSTVGVLLWRHRAPEADGNETACPRIQREGTLGLSAHYCSSSASCLASSLMFTSQSSVEPRVRNSHAPRTSTSDIVAFSTASASTASNSSALVIETSCRLSRVMMDETAIHNPKRGMLSQDHRRTDDRTSRRVFSLLTLTPAGVICLPKHLVYQVEYSFLVHQADHLYLRVVS